MFYCDLKEKSINPKNIIDYNIIILPPWVKLENIEINIFANVRSFMEMDFDIIKYYFDVIHKLISKNGIFLNINRYDKRTVGYPIKLENYPYDEKFAQKI